MAEHTPGPWHWNGVATIWNTKGHVEEVEREVIVAHVVCDYGDNIHVEPIPVREANARLIAAAPELLAACQAVLKQLETPDENPLTRACDRDKATAMIRAAIKKAKGE